MSAMLTEKRFEYFTARASLQVIRAAEGGMQDDKHVISGAFRLDNAVDHHSSRWALATLWAFGCRFAASTNQTDRGAAAHAVGFDGARRTDSHGAGLEWEDSCGKLFCMSAEQRLRDYLTRDEVTLLLRAAKKSPRHATRNYAMILLAYRHGLRASEVVGLRVSDLDLKQKTIYCRRAKGSRSSVHPMKPDEVTVVQKVLQDRKLRASEYAFSSERGDRMSRNAFWRIVAQAGERAGLPVKAYAHLLRHACGYFLANKGCDLRLIQDYLGHKQIQNTVRYTALNSARFAGLW